MKILAIVGSLRKESYNLQLAQAAQALMKKKYPDVDLEILDWHDVPLLNQDDEFPPPASVKRVRKSVEEADGIWLFSPEYNHFFPGTVKNLIDWLSRAPAENEPPVLRGKPLAMAGASIAMGGTSHAQDYYASLFSFLQVNIMHAPRLTIPNVASQAIDGYLELNESAPYLERQVDAFVAFIKKNKPE